jgi:hypothetical protein
MGGFSLGEAAFVGKIDASGKPAWLRAVASSTGNGPPLIRDLATDPDGNILFCGSYLGSFSYGKIDLPFTNNQNGYLAKANAEGEPLFAKAFIVNDFAQHLNLAVADDGSAVVSVTAYGGVDFGAGVLDTGQSYDAFLARYSPAGELNGNIVLDGTGSEHVLDIAVDSEGQPVVAGTFDSVLDIGKKRLLAGETATMFVTRLDF